MSLLFSPGVPVHVACVALDPGPHIFSSWVEWTACGIHTSGLRPSEVHSSPTLTQGLISAQWTGQDFPTPTCPACLIAYDAKAEGLDWREVLAKLYPERHQFGFCQPENPEWYAGRSQSQVSAVRKLNLQQAMYIYKPLFLLYSDGI